MQEIKESLPNIGFEVIKMFFKSFLNPRARITAGTDDAASSSSSFLLLRVLWLWLSHPSPSPRPFFVVVARFRLICTTAGLGC